MNYNIPSDISSGAFFLVLTALSKNSKLVIKNTNVNPSRIGILKILKLMGIKVDIKDLKIIKVKKLPIYWLKAKKYYSNQMS